jgi:hypothetical protein
MRTSKKLSYSLDNFVSPLTEIKSAVDPELSNEQTSRAWFCKETDACWHLWLM